MRLTIGKRLFLGFLLLLLLEIGIVGLGVVNIHRLSLLNQQSVGLILPMERVYGLLLSLQRLIMPANDYLGHGNIVEKEVFKLQAEQVEKDIARLKEVFSEGIPPEFIHIAEESFQRFYELAYNIFQIENPIGNMEGAMLIEEMDAFLDKATEALEEYHKKYLDRQLDVLKGQGTQIVKASMFFFLSFSFLGLALSFILNYFLARRIRNPIVTLQAACKRLTSGEMNAKIEINTRDEFEELASAFNQMAGDIMQHQQEIKQQNEELVTANEEAQSANEELVATNEQLLTTTEELEKAKIQVQAWAAMLEDKIEERTKELQVANDRLVTVTDGIEESIMLLDTNFKIIWANKKTLGFCGLKINEVIGDYCYKITHNQDEPCKGPQDICPITEVLEAGKPVTVLHTHLDKKGNKFYVEVTAYPIRDTQGKIVQFVHLAHNVTEKMKLEEDLRHYISDLEKANANLKAAQAQLIQSAKMASLGQLAAGLAHEINNPLTGVLNNAQLIKMQLEQKGDSSVSVAEFKEILGIIEESALRCTKITRSLLEFSRASTTAIQPLSINEVVERVFNLIGHELILQNITIQTEFAQQLPLIQGNLQLLQQVFMNLITNARWAIKKKSLDERGTITIKTQHDAQNNKVNIYITDTGIGMPPEILDRLFEPFFTTKEVGEGTGLGLSVTYGIIKEHQGTIEVKSQLGGGTTFKISLPVS